MNAVLPFPSRGEPRSQEFDLSDLIHEVCGGLETKRVACRVSIEIDAPPHTMIHGDRGQLRQAIESLLTATFAASPVGSDVVLTTFSDEASVELEIASGGSFPVAGASSVDSPADELLSGAGWQSAWSKIRRIVTRDGAEVSMGDCPDGGLAFTLHFPPFPGERAVRARRAA